VIIKLLSNAVTGMHAWYQWTWRGSWCVGGDDSGEGGRKL